MAAVLGNDEVRVSSVKLLYITASMPFGSSETFLISEVRELLRQGHDVLIVQRSPEGCEVTNRDADGLDRISVRLPLLSCRIVAAAMLESVTHPIASFRALSLLFKRRGKADNLLNMLKNFVVFPKGLWLGRLARRWGADHIHAHWILTTGTMGMLAGEATGIPWSCTAHRGDIVGANLLPEKVAHAAFVRFISESGVELARSRGVDFENNEPHVLHMGVVLPPRRQVGPPAQNVGRLLCPANLLPVKGHRYLFEAMRLLKQRGVECRLDVAGDGPLLGELKTAARSLDIDDCTKFVGIVPHNRLLELYSDGKVGVVVLPSVDLGHGLHEGIPVSLIEAMACGVPVISTTTGGIPELLHGGAGLLVPPNDSAALADAIERLLGDSDLRQRLSDAGRRRVDDDFDVENVVSRLVQLIESKTPKSTTRHSC
jgi:colanic acid/amylovoran biosynthesis glycosyltransferase